jgi:hypothetical protein
MELSKTNASASSFLSCKSHKGSVVTGSIIIQKKHINNNDKNYTIEIIRNSKTI